MTHLEFSKLMERFDAFEERFDTRLRRLELQAAGVMAVIGVFMLLITKDIISISVG